MFKVLKHKILDMDWIDVMVHAALGSLGGAPAAAVPWLTLAVRVLHASLCDVASIVVLADNAKAP